MGKTISRSSSPRLAVIQVDGVSRKHLDQALDRGLMPHLKERVDSGKLHLDTYNTGLPSQTTVAIGGLLYGKMLPGNQWFDKGTQSVVDTFNAGDAAEVAQSLAGQDGGIARGGSVYVSPLDGGAQADESFFVLSDMGRVSQEKGKWGLVKSVVSEFAELATHLVTHPVRAVQSAAHFASEVAHDLRHRHQTHRSLKTTLVDAMKESFISDAASHRIADQIRRGDAPYVYLDLANFDARSHSFGAGEKAFETLPYVDKNLDVILDAVEESDTGYQVAILADHGSATGYRFHKLYGKTLQDLSAELAPNNEVVALDFGSGAHVYLKDQPGQLDRGELPDRLRDGLRNQPGIAFTVTRQEGKTLIESRDGSVSVSDDGTEIEGKNPLADFEKDTELTARQIHDMMCRDGAGDILVFGELHEDGLVNFSTHHKGLHGGIGLEQTKPFVAWTGGLPLEPGKTEDAADLHTQFQAFLGG